MRVILLIYNSSSNSYLLADINGCIARKESGRGMNRNNTDYSLILGSLSVLLPTAPLSVCFMFHTNINMFIEAYGVKATKYINVECQDTYFSLIKEYPGKLPNLSNALTTPKNVYQYFEARDHRTLQLMLKTKRYVCNKCSTPLQFQCDKLKCTKCEIPNVCDLCDSGFRSIAGLAVHYTTIHNLNYYERFTKVIEMYCIFCKGLVKAYRKTSNFVVNKCKNKECLSYIASREQHRQNMKTTVAARTAEVKLRQSEAYRQAAYVRERKFKSTICEGGLTRKQEISLKSAPAISAKLKSKIADGSFTPCVTNSWARSRCVLDGVPYRSSFEVMFKMVHGDSVEYETIRIPYEFEGISRTYLVDFVDATNKVLYEIKPNSELSSAKVVAKYEKALEWCADNGYSFKFITEDYLSQHLSIILEALQTVEGSLDEDTKRKLHKSIKGFKQ